MNVSKCTVCNDDRSIVGKINNDGDIEYNTDIEVWNKAGKSEKCSSCKEKILCTEGVCPLYFIQYNKSRCMKFKDRKVIEDLIKFTDIQKGYDVFIY